DSATQHRAHRNRSCRRPRPAPGPRRRRDTARREARARTTAGRGAPASSRSGAYCRTRVRFDLLLKGGEVIDPGGGRSGALDVAVTRNRIAAVDHSIPAESAARTIDVSGSIVTPGLVDLHTHTIDKFSYWGVRPDPVASRTGVTTWVDAGSPGAMTLAGFREHVVKPAAVRIFTF